MKRLAGLDGLRGILALGVALSHSYSHFTGWRTGYDIFHNPDYAVDIFFILSGIVLYHSYKNKVESRGMSGIEFFVIRIFRLYPLHIIAVSLVPIALYFSTGNFFPEWLGPVTPWNLIGDLTLTNSIGIGFIPKTNVPSWSISVELFAGTAILLLSFIHKVLPWITALAGVALSLYFNIDVKGASFAAFPLLSDGVIRCVFCVSLGICAYQISLLCSEWVRKNEKFVGKLIFLVLMLTLIILFGMNITLNAYLLITPVVAMAIAVIPHVESDCKKFLESAKLVFLGHISFSLYLIHTPVVYSLLWLKGSSLDANIIYATIAVSIAVGLSTLSHKYIELPCYNYGKSLTRSFFIRGENKKIPL
ncbi:MULTISPECIES: acyltransferase family protein [Pantoea]|uniref:acyltransferase family protein n=3 Tax=Erwiniaceae TaxID=1903409 RepID=UPI0009499200|nr:MULTISPECIES: acyltransferase [Pantoea]MBS6437284.1 acyltransferase [Pantoea sp.]MDU2729639.1 acyltransferase [Pantoea sp.]